MLDQHLENEETQSFKDPDLYSMMPATIRSVETRDEDAPLVPFE